MSKLRFSVVVPCYNEEVYLPATLASLAAQDFNGSYEVIVVDNNCTDKTVEIAKKFGVKVVSESNAGVCFARQAGFKAAKGEIVISTDADTVFDHDWLTKIDRKFKKRRDMVAVCGPCDFIAAPWWGRQYPKLLFGFDRLWYLIFKHPFYITATNTAFLRSAFDGYDTSMTQGGDELAVLHALRKKGHVKFTQSYSVHTSSRRLDHGLWYNVFVSFFYYYFLGYHVNRIMKRQVIGMAPAWREVSLSERTKEQLAALGHKLKSVDFKKITAAAVTAPKAVRKLAKRSHTT